MNRVLTTGPFALAALCLLGVVSGQSLTVTPQQLNFNVLPGVSNSAAQLVSVVPNNAANTSIAFAVNTQASPWLLVQGTTAGVINNVPVSGTSLAVSVNTQGLSAGQTYNGSFTVQLSSTPASITTVLVTLVVGGASTLSVSPSSLTFTAIQGAQIGSPSSQNVTVASTAGSLTFSVSAQTQSGGNWLSISSTGGVVGSSSGTFSVSAIPAGLAAGTYSGTITVVSIPAGSLAQVQVTLTVSETSQLTVTPTALATFLYQTGGTLPPSQSLSLSTNGATIPFNVSISPAAPWLVVNPQNGTASPNTPAAVTLTPTPSGLPSGNYSTSLTITPVGGTPLPVIPVSLVVSNNPVLQVTPASLTFTSAFSGQGPIDQILNLTAVGGTVPFAVSTDQPWLSAIPSGTSTPAQVTVHVNAAGLAVGSLKGNVTLRPTNGDNYAITIPVTFTVTYPVQVSAAPAALLFSFQTNQSVPASQAVLIRSTGQPVQVTATTATTTCGTGWLTATASQNVTPVTITVTVATAGMTAGICSGTVSVAFGGSAPLTIPVTVAVSTAALLSVSVPSGFGSETVQQTPAGTGAITRTISLTSTDPGTQVPFTASATTNTAGGWLTAGPGVGTTPGNLVITILPGGLNPGTYGGQVAITSPSLPGGLPNQTFVLPVVLTVNPAITVTVTPAALTFTQTQGGAIPQNQSLTLVSSGGTATYTATVTQITGGDWLGVNPASGNASRDLTVSIKQNSLPANSTPYSAQVVLAFQNSATPPITIPVSLTVVSQQTISVAPQTLAFTYTLGAAQPAAQKLSVSSQTPVQFSVGTTSTPTGWLSVDATSGTTPRDLNVSANPQGLAVGNYTGSVSITGPGSASAVITTVTLAVSATPTPQPLTVTSTASNVSGPISPGELITIKGTALGPVSPTNGGLFTVNASGGVNSTLQGVRVLFDGIPGTPIYVSATQVNVSVPWEIAGRTSTNIVVDYNGTQSAPVNVIVRNVSPAIFTLNSTGSGQAAVANQDGSFNGPLTATTRPATQNSVIAVYMDGGGQTNPASVTGSVSSTTQLLRIVGPATATIGGQNAVVDFIGAAPGLVTGIVQVNLRVPVGVSGNALPLTINLNGIPSPGGPTVAVQ